MIARLRPLDRPLKERLLGRAPVATCYRHPSRETAVSCSNAAADLPRLHDVDAGRDALPGVRRRKAKRPHGRRSRRPDVTYVLIAINVLLFLGAVAAARTTGGGGAAGGVQRPRPVGPGDRHRRRLRRLITGGFLHAGLIHIGFNMYILYWLGTMLEPSLGHARFLALYFASLLAGSFGALLLSPNEVTVGASGAVFGLMGAAFVLQRARGIDPMQSGIGPVILFNLALSFIIPNISIGGHLGGLVGGALAAFAMERLGAARRGIALQIAACVLSGSSPASPASRSPGATRPSPANVPPMTDNLVAVVEIPKGSSNKYEWDEELGAIKLDRLLFSSLGYPTDYGFFRDTLAADGDPLDAMIAVSEPTFPGCLIEVKPVALFRMRDQNAEDNKILCVPHTDPNWSHIERLDDLSMSLRDEISHFFSIYKTPEWKVVKVDGWYPREDAVQSIERARQRWREARQQG